MKKFGITITETCRTYYVVEAENEEEAIQRFENWVDYESNQEEVADNLSRNCLGWEYSAVEEDEDAQVDIRGFEEIN